MSNYIKSSYAGIIHVNSGHDSVELYPHQHDAIACLSAKLLATKKPQLSGLLVIPTGGGKTLTAVRWLLRNIIDKGKKVLWVAHRHELLEQAFFTFARNASSTVLTNKKSFRYRIISGQHDRPVHLHHEDDLVIASKDSLNKGIQFLLTSWTRSNEDIFLVIDEAHHATAKTYRKIIDALKGDESTPRHFRMLGLTATPFRTAENEQGLLGKLFGETPIYKVDLRTLIAQGILAEPVFEELLTNIDMAKELTEKDIKSIQAFDELPEHIAVQIAESSERNKRIVSHYIYSQEKYNQLLVFAVNVRHAIVLSELFNLELNALNKTKTEIYSEYVVSDIRDMATGVRITSQENKAKIERFREGKTKVLVNVNILTEGTDLPKVQTVFLTRPTISTILMTQMIGRALRGERAGGKKQAYIVSFIDNWKDKISWVSPESWSIQEEDFAPDEPGRADKRVEVLIPIAKLEEFARMMNERIPELERLDFLRRIPVGIYAFSLLLPSKNGDELERNCEAFVFDHTQQAFRDFVNDLSVISKDVNLADSDFLDDNELDKLFHLVIDEYFTGFDVLPGYRDEDIRDILRYYVQEGMAPKFLEFKNREKCDLAGVARYIYDQALGGKVKVDYIDSLWSDDSQFWQVLFSHKRELFRRQLSIEIEKVESGEIFAESQPELLITEDKVELTQLSLFQMKEQAPVYWQKLRDQVFAKHTDSNGVITCARTEFQSKHKIHFQIDHIVPMSQGGLSVIENLQILTRRANAEKGDKVEARCMKCDTTRTMLNIRPIRMSNGRFRMSGSCEICGSNMSKLLG